MKKLTEEDIKYRFISPAIEKAGWVKDQVLTEYYTKGQITLSGNIVKRGKGKRADYLLTHKDGKIPLAIIEAKDAESPVVGGMQQAIAHAVILQVPFAYSSNGTGFLEHDFFTGSEIELALDQFPTEAQLWSRYIKAKNLNATQEEIVTAPDYFDIFLKKSLDIISVSLLTELLKQLPKDKSAS
jgi:type I restriction enzyme R subunit